MELIEKVQSELLNTTPRIIDYSCCNQYGSYIEQSAYRLLSEYQIALSEQQATADFYVAFRSFVGAVKTPIILPNFLVVDEMIKRFQLVELSNNRYDISRKYPQFINSDFINRTFDHNNPVNTSNNKYSLYSSPYISQHLVDRNKYRNPSQQLAINAALTMRDGNTALICMPTGSGKSMITQALAYQHNEGLTLVIVPTVSLALDQKKEAISTIRNNTDEEILSYYGGVDIDSIMSPLSSHKARLLFISPEAIQLNPQLKNEMLALSKTGYIKNIVIDEAHMVVEWGSSFRLDYQTLEAFRNQLLHNNKAIRTYLLSATYDRREIEVLKSLFSSNQEWLEIRCDTLRKEPLFACVKASNNIDKQKYAQRLIDLLPRPMIIYVRSPEDAENLKKQMTDDGYINIRSFTGNTIKKGERDKIINEWKSNRFSTMIATSAFGIGVNKSDVRTVLHLHIPENPNFYYQEVGRGGRDGYPSLGVMCVNPILDLKEAHSFASRVLSEEKLITRWFSMLSHSRRLGSGDGEYIVIDTSVLPEYSQKGDELHGNQKHIQWNVYVIMMLRRYELIEITDIILKDRDSYDEFKNIYLVYLKVLDKRLLVRTDESELLLRELRSFESNYYEKNYKYVEDIINSDTDCWSGMFYEVFDQVDMFCPGCNIHLKPSGLNSLFELPLRKRVNRLVPETVSTLDGFVGASREAYILSPENTVALLKTLISKGVNGLVICGIGNDEQTLIEEIQNETALASVHISIFNVQEYKDLYEHEDWYFLNGCFAVIYGDIVAENQVALEISKGLINKVLGYKAIHISKRDFNFGVPERFISECIDGPHYDDNNIEGVIANV